MHFKRHHVFKGCSGHTNRPFYHAFLRLGFYCSALFQLKCKVKDTPPPMLVKEENCSSVNSSLIRDGWRFFFISSDNVLSHYTQFTPRVVTFTLGVGCNFCWTDNFSWAYLKFSFNFFFRQNFPFSKSFTLLPFILEICYFAEISI